MMVFFGRKGHYGRNSRNGIGRNGIGRNGVNGFPLSQKGLHIFGADNFFHASFLGV